MKKILLLALSLCFIIVSASCGDEDKTMDEENISDISELEQSEAPIGYSNAFLSADIFNFTLQINDYVYKLPSYQSEFTKNGWEITGNKNEVITGGFIEDAVISKDDTSFKVQMINPKNSELPFSECPIGRISYDFSGSAEIYIADNFSLNNATKDSIIEKYGESSKTESFKDFSTLCYGGKSETGNYAEYYFKFDKKGKLIYFSMVNHYMPK